jgi:hypothetical protein
MKSYDARPAKNCTNFSRSRSSDSPFDGPTAKGEHSERGVHSIWDGALRWLALPRKGAAPAGCPQHLPGEGSRPIDAQLRGHGTAFCEYAQIILAISMTWIRRPFCSSSRVRKPSSRPVRTLSARGIQVMLLANYYDLTGRPRPCHHDGNMSLMYKRAFSRETWISAP